MSAPSARSTHTRTLLALAVTIALAATGCQPLGEGDEGDGDGASVGASGPVGSDGAAGDGGQLTIATGGTAGVYYPLGGGLANVIGDNVEGYTATISETDASVVNMQLIADGGADIAFSLGDTASDAVNGLADFEGSPVDACALARIYDNYTHVVTSADSGIASVEDLTGMRVSLGSPGSGTEVIALRILEAAGIDPDADIERQQLGVDETVQALRDGTIDAGFWSGGLPTGGLVDYATTGDMVLIPNGEYAAAMAGEYGDVYIESTIPADSYEGQTEEVSTVVVPNVLVVSSSMPEDLQRELTAVLFDHKDELVDVHAAARAIEPELAQDIAFMDICPGSQAYYDEQG
jgi:TRAP transporter TAXI family solute receptor